MIHCSQIRVRMAALLRCIFAASAVLAFGHAEWDLLVHRHVVLLRGGQASQVDYAGMRSDRAILRGYLERLIAVTQREFDQMPPIAAATG